MRVHRNRSRAPKRRNAALWIGVAAVVIAFVGGAYMLTLDFRTRAVGADGCLAYRAPPRVVAVVDDATDRLAGDQPRRWRATLGDALDQPPGSRVLFAEIGAIAPTEVDFAPVLCVPPAGNAAQQRKLQAAFNTSIDGVENRLRAASPARHSPIRRTILAVAEDRSFQANMSRLMIVESDLLEFDADGVSAYRRKGLKLPSPIGTPFSGTTIRFVVLRNARDVRFQTPQLLQAWIAWARSGGANVEVDAPWLGLAIPQAKHYEVASR
jgi:hypothetical protein